MDRIGVRAIVCSHTACLCAGASQGNEEILAAMREYPGRILGYVRLWPSDPADVEAETDRYLAAGFVGVKLHDISGFAYTDAAYGPALAAAHERRLPVLLHTWGRDDEFEQIAELAANYPDAAFLLAHAGANRTASAYAELARAHENVYLELCMSLTPRGHVARLVDLAGIDNVVWGSDALFLDMAHQIGKVLAAKLSEDDKRTLLSANARRILGRIRPRGERTNDC